MNSENKKYTKTLQESYKPDFKINELLMCDTATGVIPIRQALLKLLHISKKFYINNHIQYRLQVLQKHFRKHTCTVYGSEGSKNY